MGLSIRARQWLDEQLRQKAVAKVAAERERERLAAEYAANFLTREQAAEYLGISLPKLRRLITAGKAPPMIKGAHRQSPPRFPIDGLRAFKAAAASA